MSFDGRPEGSNDAWGGSGGTWREPCSRAWGNPPQTEKSWKERGDMARADLADWEASGGSSEQWFADYGGLGDGLHKDRIARRYNDTY